jgi:transcriptional regulator with XRE-family HTH domain
MTLADRIAELVEQHGSLRAVARVLGVDPGYLSRLQSGEKVDPGLLLLRHMKLRRVVTYERIGDGVAASRPHRVRYSNVPHWEAAADSVDLPDGAKNG